MYGRSTYTSYLVFLAFKNKLNVIWVTLLNLFFTSVFSTLSRNSFSKSVKSLLKSIEVSCCLVCLFKGGLLKTRHGHWTGVGVFSE
jgi:hypothetical protein